MCWSCVYLRFHSLMFCHYPHTKKNLRPCPHVLKWSLFPPYFLASFQEYLCPNGSIVKDCSSYSRPIGCAWNSPKTELARRLQTDSRRRTRTQQEEEENGRCKDTENEVELLLWLTLDYKVNKAQYLLQHEHKHVVRHCCCCCCWYETSQS